jgi:hypothetical protein
VGGAISFYSPSLTDTEVALTEAKRRKRSCGIDDDQIQVGLLDASKLIMWPERETTCVTDHVCTSVTACGRS